MLLEILVQMVILLLVIRDTDNIFINADIASDIMPDTDNTYNIGTATKRWATGNLPTLQQTH